MIARVIFILFLLAQPITAEATNTLDVPFPLTRHVSDFAGVITPEDRKVLEKTLNELREKTGMEGLVVTVTSLERYDTSEVRELSGRIFNAWLPKRGSVEHYFIILYVQDQLIHSLTFDDKFGQSNEKEMKKEKNVVMAGIQEKTYIDGISAGLLSGTQQLITEVIEPEFARQKTE